MKNQSEIKQILEALFFASSSPIPLKKIQSILEEDFPIENKDLKALILELAKEYDESHRSFELVEIAEGFLTQSRSEFYPYIQKLYPSKQIKLSSSILETLAIIAYKQPITKVEIEEIRGVDSGYALSQLLERSLVNNQQKLDAPGQPSLYQTTGGFLEYFGLKNLKELPTLPEDKKIPSITPSSH
jgi:segregation and condensation protein B